MKFALVLLACFVSMSTQQGYWPYVTQQSPYFSPRLFYWPWGYESSQYFQQPGTFVSNADENNGADGGAQGRMSPPPPLMPASSPMARLLFQNWFGFRGNGNFGTTTIFATSTSTAIVANFQSCIPAIQFSSAPSSQATNPCARRKRLAAEIIDALEEAFDTPEVVPSVVSPIVEVTRAPQRVERASEPAIESSQNDEIVNNSEHEVAVTRQARAGFNYVTVSSWLTTYSFITTNVKKTYTLASSGALQCLPPGFVVC